MPTLRYVGPRVIDDSPGLLLTAARNERARFTVPLNAFFSVTPEGLRVFFQDDLMAYAFFNANLRWLDRYCDRYEVDLPGGSQATALTSTIVIDALFAPSHT